MEQDHDIGHVPTRAAALERLAQFASRAGARYARERNFDYGPGRRDNVSVLSPWISAGLLDEREILAAVLAEHGREGAEKFVQEVYWRGYFRGWLEHRPQVWHAWREAVARWEGKGFPAGYREAIEGRTGIDCFDDWARELIATGWLHNHARMWFASIWIFTLRLPWELGAAFFLRHLMDADAASNTLSWRWVAGLHTQGKRYVADAGNIRRYTGNRYVPQGLAPDGFEVGGFENPQAGTLPETVQPQEGDVVIATQEMGHVPGAVAVLDLVEGACASGDVAAAFRRGALRDQGLEVVHLSDLKAKFSADDRGGIVVAAFPTGPVADALEAAGLSDARFLRRPHDAAVWPHAKKGFFALKKKIPALLDEAGLP